MILFDILWFVLALFHGIQARYSVFVSRVNTCDYVGGDPGCDNKNDKNRTNLTPAESPLSPRAVCYKFCDLYDRVLVTTKPRK